MASRLATRLRFALLLIFASTLLPGSAAADAWDLFTNSNELQSVSAIDGYVWAPSLGGVHRFDPATHTFLAYRREPGQIASNHVVQVVKDPAGVLWFATNDAGASLLDDGSWLRVADFEGLPSLNVTALEPFRDGMWVGTDKGLAFFKGTLIEGIWPDGANPSPFQSNFIRDLTSIVGRTWVATSNGVYSTVAGVTWDSLSTNLSSRDVVSLAHDGTKLWAVTANGSVWSGGETGAWTLTENGLTSNGFRLGTRGGTLVLGATDGVWRWDASGAAWTPLGGPPSASVDVADDGTIWAGNVYGLWRWNGATWDQYRTDGPLENWLTGIALQGSTLYMGADHRSGIPNAGGVSRYDDARGWRHFLPGPDPDTSLFSNDFIFLCAVDRQGYKWFGDWGSSIARLDDSGPIPQVTHFFRDTTRFTWGWSFGDDPHGQRWIGLDTGCRGCPGFDPLGLMRIDPDGTRTNFQPSNSAMTSVQIRSIAYAPDGTMWVGYADFGVDLFSDRNLGFRVGRLIKSTVFVPGLRSDNVWSIVFSGTTAWVLTDGGVTLYTVASGSPQFVSSIATPELAATGSVNPLVVDAQGGAWVASKRGLYRINPDRTTALYNTDNSPIASNSVHSLALDPDGTLWIATVDGLNRLRPSELVGGPVALSQALFVSPNPLRLSGSGSLFRLVATDGSTFAHAPIQIRDVRGRVVASLRSDSKGYASWNGTTETGRRLPAGVYFVRVLSFGFGGEPNALAQARMVLLP